MARKKKARLPVKLVNMTYEIDGDRLKAAIKQVGITQTVLAEKAGLKDPSRISKLTSGGTQTIGGESLHRILKVLRRHGCDTPGYKGPR
jgi:predicted transcriptional regulator